MTEQTLTITIIQRSKQLLSLASDLDFHPNVLHGTFQEFLPEWSQATFLIPSSAASSSIAPKYRSSQFGTSDRQTIIQ